MALERKIDFDCEYYMQKVGQEGELDDSRRTTETAIYHLCKFYGEKKVRRCSLDKCPKKKKGVEK